MLKKHAYTLLTAFLFAGSMFSCNAPEKGYEDLVSDYLTEEYDEQLLNAAAEGDEETVYKMLRRGAYVNAMDSRGNTPLALAAQAGHKECVRLLLDSPDIIITTYNNYQQTPLSSADRTVRPLIEYKLSALKYLANPTPTQQLSRGEKLCLRGAMAEAASADDANLMRFALMLGADPNMMQLSQASPAPLLHYAIINNSHQCLRLLLQYGADIHCRGFNGPSALQLAESHQATDCIDILEEALESRHAIPPLHPALNQSRLASYFSEFSDLSDRPMPIPVEERLTDTHTETETPVEHTSSFVNESNYNRYEPQAIPSDIPAEEVQQEQTSSISPSIQAPEIVDFGDGLSKESIFDSHNSSDDIFSDSISFYDDFYDDSCSLPQEANNGGGLGSTINRGVGLEGTFYDLEKDAKGKPTGIVPGNQKQIVEALHEFFATWQESKLNKYYKSKQHLYASSWYLPVASADYGPIAFGVGDPKERDKSKWECKPSAWLAVYRGKVIAPKDGYFRFIGTGDDFFAVRFNNKLALSAGYRIATDYDKKSSDDCFVYHGDAHVRAKRLKKFLAKHKGFSMITGVPGCLIWDQELGGLVAGAPFKVEEFKEYPIEIAIAEIPGGKFGFILFIEEVDAQGNPIDNSPNKKYDLFRTCDGNPNPNKMLQELKDVGCYVGDNRIPFNEEAWTWECPIEED